MECSSQRDLTGLVDGTRRAEMHRRRRMPANSRVMMNVIVFVEESFQELSRISKGCKRFREVM